MKATLYNVNIKKGNTFNLYIECVDEVFDTNGEHVLDTNGEKLKINTDLTNYSARGKVRQEYTDTIATDITCTVNSNVITLNIPSTTTTSLPTGRHVYDIEIYDTTSPANVFTVLYGTFSVEESATNG